MKNKILLLFIALGITIAIAPMSVNAANLDAMNQKYFKLHHPYYLEKVSKYQISAVGTELERYKQQALEDIDAIYNESQNRTYDPSIRTLIDDSYNELLEYLQSVTNVNQIASGSVSFFGMTFLIYTEEFENKLVDFSTIVMLDTSLVVSGTTTETLQNSLITALDNNLNCYTKVKSSFNGYYWSMIEGRIKYSKKIISEATDLKGIISALGVARSELQNIPGIDSFIYDLSSDPYCDPQYNIDIPDEDFDDDDFDEEDINLKDQLGINTPPEVDIYSLVYTNNQISNIKEAYGIYLDNYVNRQLENSGYDNTDVLTTYDTIIKNINSNYNVNEIVSYATRSLENLISTTGIDYTDYNTGKNKRLVKALNGLRETYTNKETYSENYVEVNRDTIDSAIDLIDPFYIGKEAEIPSDYVERVEDVLKKSPTYAEELKAEKATYVAKLKKYLNNKKYNQTKVVPIVNEGIKKINACPKIEDVEEIYLVYEKKANATINKYKITTSKVGYGTITKSTTVTYGKSFTVYMTPNKGYKVKSVTVDGKAVTRTTKYTFKNVVKAHTIKVVFVKK